MKRSNKTTMKIAIALSGGVDSAVAAKMLKDEGHELVGFFLKLWSDPLCQVTGENRCCNYEALEDARSVAKMLDIPFYVIDAKEEFKKEVVDYFIEEYKSIRTPNPCVICNEKIKFDLLLKKALAIGCQYLATGHYARIEQAKEQSKCKPTVGHGINTAVTKTTIKERSNESMSYSLLTGVDGTKDQSYNLYRLSQEQLAHIIFPLGEMTKKEVRELAQKWDLPVKEKAESQEICFFGDSDYREFLKRYLPAEYFKSGDIVDAAGNIIGKHEGLVNYTIGQRRGVDQQQKNRRTEQQKNKTVRPFEIVSESGRSLNKVGVTEKKPLYVIGFDLENNQLIVGEDKETFRNEMEVSDVHWINPLDCHPELDSGSIKVKIRSQAKAVECKATVLNLGTEELKNHETIQKYNNLTIVFSEPQRAVTPGQSAVIYEGDEVIGGGIIE